MCVFIYLFIYSFIYLTSTCVCTIINLATGTDTLWIHCLPCKSIIPVGRRNQRIISAAAERWAVVRLNISKVGMFIIKLFWDYIRVERSATQLTLFTRIFASNLIEKRHLFLHLHPFNLPFLVLKYFCASDIHTLFFYFCIFFSYFFLIAPSVSVSVSLSRTVHINKHDWKRARITKKG